MPAAGLAAAAVERAGLAETSRPASAGDSVITASLAVARAVAAFGTTGGGAEAGSAAAAASGVAAACGAGFCTGATATADAAPLPASSIGTSIAIGLGFDSNTSGKAMTPMPNSTTAPISLWRARVRACRTASGGVAGSALSTVSLCGLNIERCAASRDRTPLGGCFRGRFGAGAAALRQALRQNAADGVEGTEDHDSINRVGRGHRCIERCRG